MIIERIYENIARIFISGQRKAIYLPIKMPIRPAVEYYLQEK